MRCERLTLQQGGCGRLVLMTAKRPASAEPFHCRLTTTGHWRQAYPNRRYTRVHDQIGPQVECIPWLLVRFTGACGLRRQVAAFRRRDMSRPSKAQTCLRSPEPGLLAALLRSATANLPTTSGCTAQVQSANSYLRRTSGPAWLIASALLPQHFRGDPCWDALAVRLPGAGSLLSPRGA